MEVGEIPDSGNSEAVLATEEGYLIVAELPEVSVDVPGMYDFSVELDEGAEGELLYLAGSSEASGDDVIAEFFDGEGMEITEAPADGKLSVSVWLRAGVTYRPKIAVKR